MPPAPAPTKPLLRGVSHEVAAVFAVLAWIVLAGRGGHVARVAAHIYGASLFVLFTTSAFCTGRTGPRACVTGSDRSTCRRSSSWWRGPIRHSACSITRTAE